MILLDTNVISELMKTSPSFKVIDWLDQQDTTQLFISTITIAEITYGLQALPAGSRKTSLENAFIKVIQNAFQSRIFSFDEAAAYQYGKIMIQRKESGHPMSMFDGQICAIAYTQRTAIATRNIRDFSDCGVDLINPF